MFSNSFEFTKSKEFIVIDDSNIKEKGSKAPMIAGIVCGVVCAAIIAGLIAFFVKRKMANKIDFESAETADNNSTEIKIKNALYDKNDDDPFKSDFGEQNESLVTAI